MRVLLVLLIVALIVLGVLGYLDYLTWKRVAIAAGVSILVWLIGSFVTFVTTQRNLFAELNRRQEAQTQADVWARNLGFATLDLQRLSTAYAQHLAWSRALGAVLVRPFGEPSAKTPRAVLSDDGLPLGVRLGVASPEPQWSPTPSPSCAAAPAPVVDRPVGSARRGRAEAVGPRRNRSRATRTNLSRSRRGPFAAGPVGQPGQHHRSDGGKCGRCLAADEPARQPAGRSAGGAGHRRPGRRHLDPGRLHGRHRRAAGGAPARPFDGALFTAESRTGERNAARDRWARSARTGLSQVSVLVEFTEGLGTFELAGLGSAEDQRHVATDEPVF